VRAASGAATFEDVLDAPDCNRRLDWLRSRPLIVRDRPARRVLVHAGIPPAWKVRQAVAEAREIEALLAGRGWVKALASMYGDVPARWSDELAPGDRRRYTINALTRMRYCDRAGRLDFSCSGPPGSQPSRLKPWFDFPKRQARKWHIVFGHWSALGVLRRDDISAVDSGCVWGRQLTAVPLDSPGKPITVRYRDD
jgi:bis(5'-nucleosyl)-tetraphosphatase (symmetrical)